MKNFNLEDVLFSIMFVLIIIALLFGIFSVFYSNCRSAKIYNQRNETNYTCSDFFWASDQINAQTQTVIIKK
jgi:hypothetical protein